MIDERDERIRELTRELEERRRLDGEKSYRATRKDCGTIRMRVTARAGAMPVVEPKGSGARRWAILNERSLREVLADVSAKIASADRVVRVRNILRSVLSRRWPEHTFDIQAFEVEWVKTGPCPGCVRFSTMDRTGKFPIAFSGSEALAHEGRPCRPRGFERLVEVQ